MPNYQHAKVYTIVNNVNATIYVGSTSVPRLSTRMSGHRKDSRDITRTSGIYTAMREIGAENFTIILHHIFPCNSKDELVAEEMATMDAIIAAGISVYNNIIAGKPNDASKRKMAIAQTGRKHTDSTKDKISKSHIGMVFTAEHRKKISESKLGAGFSSGCIGLYTDISGLQRWIFTSKGCKRSFSCRKHGFWQAKLLAEMERKRVYPQWRNTEELVTDAFMAIELD